MKSYEFEFEAPIVFKYRFSIDENEFEGDIKDYLLDMFKSSFRNEADYMYQQVKEDLSWYIEKNIMLKKIIEKDHSKYEFDF